MGCAFRVLFSRTLVAGSGIATPVKVVRAGNPLMSELLPTLI